MEILESIPIIAVTGTKGKTTTTSTVAHLLNSLGNDTLHVTTVGHYINCKQASTAQDSKRIWGLKTPSLVPGRYLGEFLAAKAYSSPVAVLEASFSCYKAGLGYGSHKVGVFLNVFDDHIDPQSKIKNRRDLAQAKSFIFSKISQDGWAVFNADDEYVCSVISEIPKEHNVTLIPCGRDFSFFDLDKHLARGGIAMGFSDTELFLIESDGSRQTFLTFQDNDMTYGGKFLPSVWNMMHSCAAVYAFYGGELPDKFMDILQAFVPDQNDGRMVKLTNKDGVTIIADYAHESESLKSVANFARTLIDKDGKLVGVVRLNHERPDEVIREFGSLAGEVFDSVLVYDKIDGHLRKPQGGGIKRYPQIVGRTSDLVSEGAIRTNRYVQRIIREDEAIAHAAAKAKAGDVIVVIINDDVQRSLGFIKKSFKL